MRRLLAKVDPTYLKALTRSEPEAAFELLIGDEITSLWFTSKRLAVVNTRKVKP